MGVIPYGDRSPISVRALRSALRVTRAAGLVRGARLRPLAGSAAQASALHEAAQAFMRIHGLQR